MRWPWSAKVEAAQGAARPSNFTPPIDQFLTLAALLNPGGAGVRGVAVDEASVMGISAFFRGVSLIAGQLAALPLESWTGEAADRRRVTSIFDNPDGDDGQTPFEWKRTAFLNMIIHGAVGAQKIKNEGGGLARLAIAPKSSYTVRAPTPAEVQAGDRPRGGLFFDVTGEDGRRRRLDADDFWYVPGMSIDGRTGVSLLTYARLSLATTIAGDEAAGNMFANGAMIAGIATPKDNEDDISGDIPEIRSQIDSAVGGVGNAGKIAVIARALDFVPWQMTAADAQFLQSRQFQIEEIARWLGVPPHLLMQTEKQTSWGTGVEEQNRALGKSVLDPWATGFEERASRLLARPRSVAFNWSKLERTSPDREHQMARDDYKSGLITLDEARVRLGLQPVGGEAGAAFYTAPAPAAPAPGNDDPEGGGDA